MKKEKMIAKEISEDDQLIEEAIKETAKELACFSKYEYAKKFAEEMNLKIEAVNGVFVVTE